MTFILVKLDIDKFIQEVNITTNKKKAKDFIKSEIELLNNNVCDYDLATSLIEELEKNNKVGYGYIAVYKSDEDIENIYSKIYKEVILKRNEHIKEYYTLEDLTKEFNMNIQTLRIYIKEGKLKASKVGVKYIITRDNVNEFLKANEV